MHNRPRRLPHEVGNTSAASMGPTEHDYNSKGFDALCKRTENIAITCDLAIDISVLYLESKPARHV